MPELCITDFSCIKEARFEVAPVNVIIGQQGSGKSVTTKLNFFCADILRSSLDAAERGESLDDFKRGLARNFSVWFPSTAWGNKRFHITYYASKFGVRLLRRVKAGRPSDEVAIWFSPWFETFFRSQSRLFSKERQVAESEAQLENPTGTFDALRRVRDTAVKRLQSDLGEEYISSQTFIPAGRAFFTSIGRLMAGFEQSGSLDPITLRFARTFASLRDLRSARYSSSLINRLGEDFVQRRIDFMEKLFGGEVRFERDSECVEARDGRKIPFSSLSSGQQELLPMWTLIDYFSERDAIRRSGNFVSSRRMKELVYIEEPEAHLFPSAQGLLLEFLIGSVISERKTRNLILTTHSPYIMGQLNVFLKAGQLSRRKKRNQIINEIVPRECWLTSGQLSAFAIEGGRMRNLLDEEGLIDARYLDQVSEVISSQFSRLLQVEAEI